MLAVGEKEGKGRRKNALCERVRSFQDLKASLLYPGSLDCRSSRHGLPIRPSANVSVKEVVGYPDFLLFHGASLLHPCTRVPKWDAGPECQPYYYQEQHVK
jgi:hypothetical protein